MRRILCELLAFALLAAAFSVGASRAYETLVMGTSKISIQDRGFRAASSSWSTLIMGDSHVGFGIDPSFLPGSYNAGFDAENYAGTLFKLRYVLNNRPGSVRMVVCSFDPNMFSSYKAAPPMRNAFVWRRYFNLSNVIGVYGPWQALGYLTVSRVFPHNGELASFVKFVRVSMIEQQPPPQVLQGHFTTSFRFDSLSEAQRTTQGTRRAASHFENQVLYDPLMTDCFWQIVDLCESRGIRLVLVTLPGTDDYYRPATEIYGVDRENQSLRLDLGNRSGVVILGYSDLFFERDDLFMNPDHLNEEGAQLFSRYLAQDLQSVPPANRREPPRNQ